MAPAEIVGLAARAGLTGVEWGGDVHVPHGDVAQARAVAGMTRDAGLEVAAYGSYYRVGEMESPAFESVLETAVALGAPTIRVWAGRRGSADADAQYRAAVIRDSRRIADLAGEAGVTVSYEYHRNTLTDTRASVHRLLTEVNHPGMRTLWQPPLGADDAECVDGLREVLPWLSNLHVFHWWPSAHDRRPLSEGAERWRRFLAAAGDGTGRYALLEFVRDEDPDTFLHDASVLRELLNENAG